MFNDDFIKEEWIEYKKKIISNGYSPKLHYHLDGYFSFEKRHQEIEKIVTDKSNKESKEFSYLPLVKTLSKTPRYKYQDGAYHLEKKIRPIFLTAHRDKYIYGFYSHLLNRLYQAKIKGTKIFNVPIAYRSDLSGKCNIQFSKEVFDFVRSQKQCSVVLTDISSFFDNIDHKILKRNWERVLGLESLPIDHYKVFKALTQYKYLNLSSFYKKFSINIKKEKPKLGSLLNFIKEDMKFNEKMKILNDFDLIVKNKQLQKECNKGIPQGLSISATLSNIYMWDFDEIIQNYVSQKGGFYRRYCDDVIIVLPNDNFDEILTLLHEEIAKKRGMIMKSSKTELAQFSKVSNKSRFECKTYDCPDLEKESYQYIENGNKKIQYLGFTFNGRDVLIRESSISRYYRKMSRRVRKTIRMAYSGRSKYSSDIIFRKQILERYTHYGSRNFLKYVYDASSKSYLNSKGEEKFGHDSIKMKKQVSRHMEILDKLVQDKNLERYLHKKKKGKKVRLKKWKNLTSANRVG
ncbi:reverse transcriptase domain-containing protein [Lewinella sp. LCG006]|uniref:reverse transcriptase domain-containing protein n=1 Tax=Lewinella sp. LCG006 TaxID=3231911 RepID=UPI00345F5DCE